MLAYLFWHRPYATTTVKQYEEALLRFQQHLGQQHARSGLRGRGAFSGTQFSTHCTSNFRQRRCGGVRWCSVQARSSLSSCRRVSMLPHHQVGPRWPSSGCASMRPRNTTLMRLVSKTFAGAIHQRRIRPIVPACFFRNLAFA